MMFGLSPGAFTTVHVVISLIGIATGLAWLLLALRGRSSAPWTAVFLAATIATSGTGFLFPISGTTPALVVGALSLVLLAVAVVTCATGLGTPGRRTTFLVTATIALYLNVFVLVAQAFQKVPALNALAPTGAEPPFAAAQAVVLIAFVAAGWALVRGPAVRAA